MNNEITELARRLSKGDMNALAELYDMLSDRIFNYARTLTKSKETAEDITHDVFLQINKHAQRISRIENPAAYIMVITRNLSLNAIKRDNRAESLSDLKPQTGETPPMLERIEFEEAFSKLPVSQRETVYLHLIYGFTLKDIAEIQGAPLVTVKWRYAKALSYLREYFSLDKEELLL